MDRGDLPSAPQRAVLGMVAAGLLIVLAAATLIVEERHTVRPRWDGAVPQHVTPAGVAGMPGRLPGLFELLKTDPLAVFLAMLKRQAMRPVTDHVHREYPDRTAYRTEFPRGGHLTRVGVDYRHWPDTPGTVGGDPRFVVSDGIAPAGLTEHEAELYVDYLRGVAGLVTARRLTYAPGADGRVYVSVDVRLDPRRSPVLGVTERRAVRYYLDVETLLPAFAVIVGATYRLVTYGFPRELDPAPMPGDATVHTSVSEPGEASEPWPFERADISPPGVT